MLATRSVPLLVSDRPGIFGATAADAGGLDFGRGRPLAMAPAAAEGEAIGVEAAAGVTERPAPAFPPTEGNLDRGNSICLAGRDNSAAAAVLLDDAGVLLADPHDGEAVPRASEGIGAAARPRPEDGRDRLR